MTDFLAALALVLVIEGVLWAAFPEGMRQGMRIVLELPAERLRLIGLAMAAAGLLGVWLVRG